MRRREFIGLSGAVAAWPITARAQRPVMPVIGFLTSRSPNDSAPYVAAFRQGLAETGYVEGQNVAIEYRWGEGQNDRLPAFAHDLVQSQVAVVVAIAPPAAFAAKAATATIPIVFYVAADPVEIGLVASLNRPGGNLTGMVSLSTEVVSKQLGLLHELVPTATAIALLVNPTNPTNAEPETRRLQAAVHTLGFRLHVVHASTERDIETVFATLIQMRTEALVIGADPFFGNRSGQLAALTVRHSLPAIFAYREFVAAGGLVSYASRLADGYRQAGIYAGRILKGAKPADLPVVQPTKFELIINLNTAKALGIAVPPTLLVTADEVIE